METKDTLEELKKLMSIINKIPEIIPAIMPVSFKSFGVLEDIIPETDMIQVDVMDGKFTKKSSWPYVGSELDSHFVSILQEDEGFPYWNDLDFEVDLMISNPEKVWRDWVTAGAKRIIFHIESVSNPKELVEYIQKNAVPKESPLYTEIGFAINLDTPIDLLYPIMDKIDFIQCMGIAEIGVQGNPFDRRVLERLSHLRKMYPELILSVDGGVTLENAKEIVASGANRLAVGSGIFGKEDPLTALMEFKNLF